MSKQAVLFDLDGTLLNTIDDLSNAVNYMLKHFGYDTFSVDEYKYKVGNGMPKLMERSLPDGHKTQEDINNAMSVFMPYYNEHKMDNTAPYDGIIEVLQELKSRRIKTAVITNKAHIAAVPLIDEVFPCLFDCVTGQKDSVPTKPDPTCVFNTIKALGVKPEDCIFVGDSSVDMQTAKNSKIQAVGVLWGFRKADELLNSGADVLIAEPNELLNLL